MSIHVSLEVNGFDGLKDTPKYRMFRFRNYDVNKMC